MFNEEFHLQVAVINYIRATYPDALFTIAPNGMKLPIGVAVKLKRMGYRKGVFDLLFFEPRGLWHGLHIELKAPNGRTTPEQKTWFSEARKRGYMAFIAIGYDEAVRAIDSYFKIGKE